MTQVVRRARRLCGPEEVEGLGGRVASQVGDDAAVTVESVGATLCLAKGVRRAKGDGKLCRRHLKKQAGHGRDGLLSTIVARCTRMLRSG